MSKSFKCPHCGKYFPAEMYHCPHCGTCWSKISKMMIDEKLTIYDVGLRKGDHMACKTPGKKIRSKGKGRGLARGKGKGPMGTPRYDKRKGYAT